ncbi:hypothetical protein ASG87_03455 [Frateuria sp. Soil773]|nr:hypothetical protein ASG87_03455 [Frateuria sp. Soil773]
MVCTVRDGSITILGLPPAARGDMATCPRHGGVQPFVESCSGHDTFGAGVVLEGHKLACGCHAISSCATMHWMEDVMPQGLGEALDRHRQADAAPAQATPALRPESETDPGAPAHTLLQLRIGLFFDGTANNANNTRLGEQCRARPASEAERQALLACKPYMAADRSYLGGETNIGRLFKLYPDNVSNPDEPLTDRFFIARYIDGSGTTSGEPDSDLYGMAQGTGATGIASRVEHELTIGLREAFNTFQAGHADAWITGIRFDVFGFSRGAAAARHAIHQINLRQRGPLAYAIAPSRLRLAPDFDWQAHVKVAFAGLYDSVAMLGGGPRTGETWRSEVSGVSLHLPAGCADTVVRLTARDEKRINFPLTSAAPPWRDIPLPGVHADVGGGYHMDMVEDVLVTEPAISGETASTPLRKSTAWRQASRQLAEARARFPDLADKLDVHAWVVPGGANDSAMALWLRGPMQTVGAAVRLRHRVSGAYQLVTLRVMHALAKQAQVPWRQSPDDVPALSLPGELLPVFTQLMAYARGAAGDRLQFELECLLRQRYLHHSENWNMIGDSVSRLDVLHINRPTDDGRRQVFPNESGVT